MTETTTTPKEKLSEAIAALGLTVEATFVPWSRSRNRAEVNDRKVPRKSLNWRVTLKRGDRVVLTTDYSAGIGHCPAHKASVKDLGSHGSIMREGAISFEVENGRRSRAHGIGGEKILPDSTNVVWSLLQDASVLDAGGFESWAADFGYDTDSRKAEATYRVCLDLALQLRAGIGEEGLSALRLAGEDY